MIARRCFVSGRVQGVFYRASTREQAERRHLVGHAHNLDDGRVEVLIIGDTVDVLSLIDWLKVGPPAAQVATVEVQEVAIRELERLPDRFSTG